MDNPFSAIPWNKPVLWQEANASLSRCMQCSRHKMDEPFRLADRLGTRLLEIAPPLDRLCSTTCPNCTDICCQRAWVWFDFKDLLFLHLAGVAVPAGQLMSRRGDRCRYSGPDGCQLSRLQRPFVCTWYLCPAQTHILNQQPKEKQRISAALQQIKETRRRMEDRFIKAIFR